MCQRGASTPGVREKLLVRDKESPLSAMIAFAPNAKQSSLNWGAEIVREAPCLRPAFDPPPEQMSRPCS